MSCLHYLGVELRRQFAWLPNDMSARDVGKYFLRKFVLVHLRSGYDKALLLCFMARKLFALVRGQVRPDNMDVLGAQELWTPGMLYGACVKVRVGEVGATCCR